MNLRTNGTNLLKTSGGNLALTCGTPPGTCCEQISGVEWVIDDTKDPPYVGCCPDLIGTYVPDPFVSSECLYRIVTQYPPPLTPCTGACVVIGSRHYYLKTFDLQTEIFNVSPFATTTLTLVYRTYNLIGGVCTEASDVTQTWTDDTTGFCPLGNFDVLRFKPTACADISIHPGMRLTTNFS